MQDFIQQIREQVMRIWDSLSMQQRAMFVAAPILLLLAMGAAVYFASQPQWSTLMTSRDDAQLGRIESFLEEKGIAYKADDQSIQVDQSEAPRIRRQLATQGLIGFNPGKTYEIFEETRLGMTERMFDLQSIIALQNVLEKTIVDGANITAAYVTITDPPQTLFLKDKIETTASVKLISQRPISSDEVAGIQRLVAAAVPGLRPQKVIVSDNQNRMLSEDTDIEPGVAKMNKQLEIQQYVEDKLKRKLESLLIDQVGESNYKVSVNVVLDWEKKRIKNVHIDKSGAAPLSTKEYGEKTKERGISGAPGVTGNVQDSGIGSESDISSTEITEEITNYIHPWFETLIEEDQGEIQSIAAAIQVGYKEDVETGEKVSYTPEELDAFKSLLRVGVGLNETEAPNDPNKFTLKCIPFDTTAERKRASEQFWGNVMSIVRSAIPLLLLIALGVFAYFFFQKAFAPPEERRGNRRRDPHRTSYRSEGTVALPVGAC